MNTVMPAFTLSKRVALGACELDYAVPDWYKRIDINRLNMNSGRDCILGQLYGSYLEGRFSNNWSVHDAELRGFLVFPFPRQDELVEPWVAEITKRLLKDAGE